MRHRVSIQQRSTTKDAAGEQLDTWTEVMERPAAKVATPGTEVWASAQRSGVVPTIFKMRREPLVTIVPGMRIVTDGKTYDIRSVFDATGRGEEMTITAEELVNG